MSCFFSAVFVSSSISLLPLCWTQTKVASSSANINTFPSCTQDNPRSSCWCIRWQTVILQPSFSITGVRKSRLNHGGPRTLQSVQLSRHKHVGLNRVVRNTHHNHQHQTSKPNPDPTVCEDRHSHTELWQLTVCLQQDKPESLEVIYESSVSQPTARLPDIWFTLIMRSSTGQMIITINLLQVSVERLLEF